MLQMVTKNTADPAQNESAAFDDFWTLYPKRVARLDAVKAWAKLSDAERMDALVALVKWRRVWLARDEMQFVPHAATWLRGARWEDELPSDSTPLHASHVATSLPPLPERGEMPAEVRAALAKLRGRK